ncbi:Polysaccharide pyruvyl transferase [bacterium A37T11]|nr:Polysaccharide pyruvyl transferase [bacterium A37T11]
MKKNKKLQIGIIWANPYNKNLGVAALAYSALAILNDVAAEHQLSVEFSFFGSERSGQDQLRIGERTLHFTNIPGLNFYDWKWRIKLWLFPKKHHLVDIRRIEYAFDIAEGDSFTDIYGDVRFRKILNSKFYFGKKAKKLALLPQTIGPFNNPKNEVEAFKAMDQADIVISRDQQSYAYTARKLPSDKIAETIDVAFYMPYTKIYLPTDFVHVGINVSGLLWNGGYSRNNQFEMHTDYKKLIREVIKYFCSQVSVKVHIISHVIPDEQAVEDDYAAAIALKEEFPKVDVIPKFTTPIEAKSYISGMDFFTGARMHACIAAFSTGVPVYPMAYSRKFNGLFADTLQYPWLGDCVKQEESVVFQGLRKAFDNKNQLKAKISQSNQEIVKPRLDYLKELLYHILTK